MKFITAENPSIRIFIQYSLQFLLIGIISRTFPLTGSLYYIVPVVLVINILLAIITIPPIGKTLYHFLIIFVFPVYCLISSIWSLNPIISLQRSLYLLLLYAGILSTVLLYKKSFPYKGIEFLIPANILVIVVSAISLIFSIPADRWTGGNGLGFMGFAGHQNTLAAALLFTLPGIFALRAERPAHRAKSVAQSSKGIGYMAKGKASTFLLRLWRISSYFSRISFLILILTANCLLITLTYSRAAILALGIGIITYLFVTSSKKILSFLFAITALLLVFYFTIPFIQNSIDNVLNKDGGNILSRRTVLWEPSFEAAKLGGLFGLGYGVSAPEIKTPVSTGSHYEDGRYVREKGNSVLAMIEETGYIGLLLFLLPLILLIRKCTIHNLQFTIQEKIKNNYTFYIVHCTLAALLHSRSI